MAGKFKNSKIQILKKPLQNSKNWCIFLFCSIFKKMGVEYMVCANNPDCRKVVSDHDGDENVCGRCQRRYCDGCYELFQDACEVCGFMWSCGDDCTGIGVCDNCVEELIERKNKHDAEMEEEKQ